MSQTVKVILTIVLWVLYLIFAVICLAAAQDHVLTPGDFANLLFVGGLGSVVLTFILWTLVQTKE